jgi:hypothetical protein
MKKLIQLIQFQIIFSLLILPFDIYAQGTLNLLKKLDQGLPPSGLNASYMGDIISCIGDVNNDGFDDWAAGFPNAANYETGAIVGKVYIYFGSNAIQSNQTPDLIISGEDGKYNFGQLIASAGDVNNDGYSDILISKNRNVALFYGGNPMDTIPDLIFEDENGSGSFGYIENQLPRAGDVNNDGFDDVIIGSRNFAYIFFGGRIMDSKADIVLKGQQEGDMFGFYVSPAGDFNKDGFDDVIVGASGYDLNGYDTGRAYVFFGGTEMDTIPDMIMTGEHEQDQFGSTVSDAGDLNKDGFSDILVAAYHYENKDKDWGRVYIYFGGAVPDTTADLIIDGSNGCSGGDINKDGYSDLIVNNSIYWGGAKMDNVADATFENTYRFAGSGDYNNDGFADIITGKPDDKTNGENAGKVSVFFGRTKLNTDPDAVFYGAKSYEYFGACVSTVGDLNNDGFDDFVIGAEGNDENGSYAGSAYLYFGAATLGNKPDLTFLGQKEYGGFGSTVSFAGDVNSDGFDDLIIGGFSTNQAQLFLGKKDMNSVPDFVFKGEKAYSHFGNSVSNAGDFNGDGFDDILIGDLTNSTNGTNKGRACLYFGAQEMDTNPDLTFEGEEIFNEFGNTVTCAGDVNNDGFSDIMVGAPWYDRINILGRLYIYYGSSSPDSIPDVVITGTHQYRQMGSIIASAGDVNNDGYDDVIVGMPFEGNAPNGMSYVDIYYGGAIMDTVPDVKIEKMVWGFGFGISGAGDLNDDGFDDVIIGGSDKNYIYYGGSPMDTIPDLFIPGEGRGYDFGPSLSFAGDINNDGYSDLLMGSRYSSAVGTGMGRVFIYSSNTKNTGIQIVNDKSFFQVFPNPFNTEAIIKYNLQKQGKIQVKIVNISGQEIETLVNGSQGLGVHQLIWQPKNLPNGIYFCRIQSQDFSETKKVIFQK